MFLLNGKPLAIDVPFSTEDGTQYPANWLRLASDDDKAAVGITEVADPVRADDRFYWNGDINTPKALDDKEQTDEQGNKSVAQGLKSQFIGQIKAQAGSMLSATDWKIVRAAEGIKAVDQATLTARAEIRAASDANEAAVLACTTVAELAALQFTWPEVK